MKFLVDAQLPSKMAKWLIAAGHDAVHTDDLPDGDRTTDKQMLDLAETDDRVVVTKDNDFVDSFTLRGKPKKLLLIATGNISNKKLEALFVPLIPDIVLEFAQHSFLELDLGGITPRA